MPGSKIWQWLVGESGAVRQFLMLVLQQYILGYYKRNRHFQCFSETKLLMI